MASETRDKDGDSSAVNDNNVGGSSYFQKTVCLHDWWLVKAEKDFEGKKLAIAGSTSRELKAVRFFTSAPIVKRYDVFTLETADGICVCIKGFINKQRTIENGFSSGVFNHFYFGFPPYWEEFGKKCLGENLIDPGKEVEIEVDMDNWNSGTNQTTAAGDVFNTCNIDNNAAEGSNMGEETRIFDIGVEIENSNDGTMQTGDDVDVLDTSNRYRHAANLPTSVEEVEERIYDSPSNIETNEVNVTSRKSKVNASPYIPGYRTTRSRAHVRSKSRNKNSEVCCSTTPKERASTKKVQDEKKVNDNVPHSLPSKLSNVKGKYSLSKETRKKLDFEEVANSVSWKGKGKECVLSPKSLSFKRSRSGRVLLPPLEFWRNQIPVYDQDRRITGIKEEVDTIKPSGSRLEPQKRKKLL